MSKANAASIDRAGECGVVRFTTQFFILDKAKALPITIRIGSQTAWEAVRLDFIDNKDKIIAKDYELHGRCDFLYYGLYFTFFTVTVNKGWESGDKGQKGTGGGRTGYVKREVVTPCPPPI